MIYLPPLRRLLLPALVILTLIVFYRSRSQVPAFPPLILHSSPSSPEGIHRSITGLKYQPLPIFNASTNHLPPPKQYFYSENRGKNGSSYTSPSLNPSLGVLFRCPVKPNQHTGHIRLPNIVQNISQILVGANPDGRVFWNPTIISLPYWSENQYLVVSRIVTDGNHQENVLCEANICHIGSGKDARSGEKPCTADDLFHVGPAGGMRCVTPPFTLSVPPTPAKHCEGKFGTYVDIPGFHDPRTFWSGKGEPLMMVNTQYLSTQIPYQLLPANGHCKQIPLRLLRPLAHRPSHLTSFSLHPPLHLSYSPLSRAFEILRLSYRIDPQSTLYTLSHREKLDAFLSLNRRILHPL